MFSKRRLGRSGCVSVQWCMHGNPICSNKAGVGVFFLFATHARASYLWGTPLRVFGLAKRCRSRLSATQRKQGSVTRPVGALSKDRFILSKQER